MKKQNPNYYSILPANVRYDKTLPDGAKILFSELTALANKEGYSWASNAYFADLYGKDNSTISKYVSKLQKGGYIRIETVLKSGSKEVAQRKIFIVENLQIPSKQRIDSIQYPREIKPIGIDLNQGGIEIKPIGIEITPKGILNTNNKNLIVNENTNSETINFEKMATNKVFEKINQLTANKDVLQAFFNLNKISKEKLISNFEFTEDEEMYFNYKIKEYLPQPEKKEVIFSIEKEEVIIPTKKEVSKIDQELIDNYSMFETVKTFK